MSTVDEIYGRINDEIELIQTEKDGPPSEIQEFYAGKTVFVTGVTGFLGKLLVEKLLRGCPDIKRIYVHVRNKRGLASETIIKKVFENQVFDRLKSEMPNYEEKITLIKGDLVAENLGISEEDREILKKEVNVMIHNGATTKFDEKISIALKINVLATKAMLDLAMECKNMESFIYISTAYSHCYRKKIEEKFYPPPASMKAIQDIIEVDENTTGLSQESLSMILGDWPNVYCFTKSMAEDLVRQYGERAHFPCGVNRPSMVLNTYEEPIVGWVGNFAGPGAVFYGLGMGVIHASPYSNYDPMDLVPADFVTNSIIAATWDLARKWKNNQHNPLVYNIATSDANPTVIPVLWKKLLETFDTIGTEKAIYYPFVIHTNKYAFLILHFFFHFLPALLGDAALILLGKKARLCSLCWMAVKHLDKMDYFVNGNWRIKAKEMMKVFDSMNSTDKKLFFYDVRALDWEDFLVRLCRGHKLYTVKESYENLEPGRRHARRLKIIHEIVRTVFWALLLYFFLGRFFI